MNDSTNPSLPVSTDDSLGNSQNPSGQMASIVAMAVWLGLVVGLSEVGLVLAFRPHPDESPGFFRMNRHIVWMIPLFNLALFGGVGLALAGFAKIRPRIGWRVSTAVLSFLAVLTLLLTFPRIHGVASLILAIGIAYRLSRRIGRHEAGSQRFLRYSLPVVALVTIGIAGSSYYENVVGTRRIPNDLPPAPAAAPNVILVVLDTVRADRLSLYGYERPTSPNLERLAERGVRFDRARSTAPWTLPSHASIMTGRWPHQLGAGFKGPLDATYPTIAEFLGSRGYDTGGFVGNLIYTTRESGIGRGFDRYDDHDTSLAGIIRSSTLVERTTLMSDDRKDADQVSAQLLQWLGTTPGDRPFFAFLNYFDAHDPYGPPASFDRHFRVTPETDQDAYTIRNWFFLDKKTLTPRQIALINDAYDDSLAYLDGRLGQLFDELERRGHLENTMIIVTADHGEHFGEHNLYGHASSLYSPEIHVPLLIIPPGRGRPARSVTPTVSLRDLATTIAEVAGFPDDPFPGESLARHWNDEADPNLPVPAVLSEVEGPAFTTPNQRHSPAFRGSMQSLVMDERMYIRNGDGVEEFYDLNRDPNQIDDIIESPGAQMILQRFRTKLDEMLEDVPKDPA
jgi:arylsulfatase A-like enzyme